VKIIVDLVRINLGSLIEPVWGIEEYAHAVGTTHRSRRNDA
jgi:hypothetical protein